MLRWKSISVSKKGRPSQYEALTKIGIPIIRIRMSHSHGIFILKIPVYGKTVFILKGPLFQFDDVEHPWIKVKLPRSKTRIIHTWWRHQMKKISSLLALCVGNSPVTGEFPSQRPVRRSFDVFFDLRMNKRLSKQSIRRWFESPSCSLWRHCNGSYLCSHGRCGRLVEWNDRYIVNLTLTTGFGRSAKRNGLLRGHYNVRRPLRSRPK